MDNLHKMLKLDRFSLLWIVILIVVASLMGCAPALSPFETRPFDPLSPIGLIQQRCIDAGDVWEKEHLRCRQVAPWKKLR